MHHTKAIRSSGIFSSCAIVDAVVMVTREFFGDCVLLDLFTTFFPSIVSVRVSDASGSLVVQEVATQPLTQDLLNSSVTVALAFTPTSI